MGLLRRLLGGGEPKTSTITATVIDHARAGMYVHPRVTKAVQLLVDCDSSGHSANELRARDYGIEIVNEPDFWKELGIPVEIVSWS